MASKSNAAVKALAEPLTAAEEAHIKSGGETDLSPSSVEQTETAPIQTEAQPTQVVETQTEVDPKDTAPKTVPLSALHEERERRKELAAEVKELRANQTKLLERAESILKTAQPQAQQTEQKPTAPTIPDLDKDPLGHLLAVNKLNADKIAELTGTLSTRDQQSAEQVRQYTEAQQIGQRAGALEREFMAKTPDYSDATNFLAKSRADEFRLMGITDPVVIDQNIKADAQNLARYALANNLNPADIAYGMAKARGYVTKAPAQTTETTGQTDATAQLTRVKEGQQQSTSLSQTRGSAQTQLTVNRLLEMNDADFLAAFNTKDGKALFGA